MLRPVSDAHRADDGTGAQPGLRKLAGNVLEPVKRLRVSIEHRPERAVRAGVEYDHRRHRHVGPGRGGT
jgi:hypothetical protein